jgi:hypothetical protein
MNAQGTKYNSSKILHPVFSEKVVLSLVPVPIIFSGFRVDVDVRITDNIWLNIAPRLNLKSVVDSNSKFVFGGGLDINARYYIENKPLGFYFSVGLGAEYNRLGNITKNTKEYYEVTAIRFGGQTYLGYSFRLWSRCVMDIYAGATFRHSKNSFSTEVYKNVVEADRLSPFSYYFSGVCFDGGVRIGITL